MRSHCQLLSITSPINTLKGGTGTWDYVANIFIEENKRLKYTATNSIVNPENDTLHMESVVRGSLLRESLERLHRTGSKFFGFYILGHSKIYCRLQGMTEQQEDAHSPDRNIQQSCRTPKNSNEHYFEKLFPTQTKRTEKLLDNNHLRDDTEPFKFSLYTVPDSDTSGHVANNFLFLKNFEEAILIFAELTNDNTTGASHRGDLIVRAERSTKLSTKNLLYTNSQIELALLPQGE